MIDAKINCDYAEDDLVFGGDAEELLSNTFSIISSFYAGLLRQCDNCAEFYRAVLENPETLTQIFDDVFESFLEERHEYDDEEDYEYPEELEPPIPFRRVSKDGFKGGKGLCGIDYI